MTPMRAIPQSKNWKRVFQDLLRLERDFIKNHTRSSKERRFSLEDLTWNYRGERPTYLRRLKRVNLTRSDMGIS